MPISLKIKEFITVHPIYASINHVIFRRWLYTTDWCGTHYNINLALHLYYSSPDCSHLFLSFRVVASSRLDQCPHRSISMSLSQSCTSHPLCTLCAPGHMQNGRLLASCARRHVGDVHPLRVLCSLLQQRWLLVSLPGPCFALVPFTTGFYLVPSSTLVPDTTGFSLVASCTLS